MAGMYCTTCVLEKNFFFFTMATVYSSTCGIGFFVPCRIDERGYPLIFKTDIPNHGGGRTSMNSKLDKV